MSRQLKPIEIVISFEIKYQIEYHKQQAIST